MVLGPNMLPFTEMTQILMQKCNEILEIVSRIREFDLEFFFLNPTELQSYDKVFGRPMIAQAVMSRSDYWNHASAHSRNHDSDLIGGDLSRVSSAPRSGLFFHSHPHSDPTLD